MSRGITIADFVQQVLYAMYQVRLDVDASVEGSFHSHSDKFKEIVMEANFMLQEFQKEQDWNFLREKWELGRAYNPHDGIQEFEYPDDVYKVCTGYGDAVRLHKPTACCGYRYNPRPLEQIPFEEARTGNRRYVEMFNEIGQMNVDANEQRAFIASNTLSFNRPWFSYEQGGYLETDVIRRIEPLHICDSNCPDDCPKAYEELQFKWMPDPYYFVVKTAARKAAGDPSLVDRVQQLTDEASKVLSGVRKNDSAHTTTDTYETNALGYISVI